MVKIKPLTIELEEEIWNKFKEITPRVITLNEAVVNLIKKEIDKNEKTN